MRIFIVVIDLHNLYEAHVFLVSVLWSIQLFKHKQDGGQLVPMSQVSISITTTLIIPFNEGGQIACGKLVKVILRASSFGVPSAKFQVPFLLASRNMEAKPQLLSLKDTIKL